MNGRFLPASLGSLAAATVHGVIVNRVNLSPLMPDPAVSGAELPPGHYAYKSVKHVSAIDFAGKTFNQGFSGFAQHARGRVAYEERGRWGPGWLLRFVYRLMIPAGIWLARAEPDEWQRARGSPGP